MCYASKNSSKNRPARPRQTGRIELMCGKRFTRPASMLLRSDAQVDRARLIAEQVDLLLADEIRFELQVGRRRIGGQEVVLRVSSRAVPADSQRQRDGILWD